VAAGVYKQMDFVYGAVAHFKYECDRVSGIS
jgi:hypothetical protein